LTPPFLFIEPFVRKSVGGKLKFVVGIKVYFLLLRRFYVEEMSRKRENALRIDERSGERKYRTKNEFARRSIRREGEDFEENTINDHEHATESGIVRSVNEN